MANGVADAGTQSGAGLGAAQGSSPWYAPLIHGGGSSQLSNNDLAQLSNIKNLQQDPNLDPAIASQLAGQRNAIVNRDNGGYVGALGRMLTGSGQTGGEKFGGGALQLLAGVLRNQAAANALRNSTGNMMGMQRQVLNSQRGTLGQGF